MRRRSSSDEWRWWPAFVGAGLVLVGLGCSPGPAADFADPVAARGAAHYSSSCAVCHGRGAQGLPGLGAALRANAFVASRTDEELVTFVALGRGRSDPANTSGLPMPPRGGNPGLRDEDLLAIVSYLRRLDGAAAPRLGGER